MLLTVIVNVTVLLPEKIHRVQNHFDGRTIPSKEDFKIILNQNKLAESRKTVLNFTRGPFNLNFIPTFQNNYSYNYGKLKLV